MIRPCAAFKQPLKFCHKLPIDPPNVAKLGTITALIVFHFRGIVLLLPTKTLHSSAGMTLVELMVVIGIIGVLSSLVIGSFNRFTMKAKRAAVISVLHQVETLTEAARTNAEPLPWSTNLNDDEISKYIGVGSLLAKYKIRIEYHALGSEVGIPIITMVSRVPAGAARDEFMGVAGFGVLTCRNAQSGEVLSNADYQNFLESSGLIAAVGSITSYGGVFVGTLNRLVQCRNGNVTIP